MKPPLRPLTYSRSLTFTLTHDCPWHCAYCGFRTDSEGWLPDSEIDRLCHLVRHHHLHEALLISGEAPGQLPHLRAQLRQRGHRDFIDFANSIAQRALHAGALPHGNYGALNETQLARLRPFHVSMGLMLENIHDHPWAPQKRAAGRLATLNAAGRLRIPFTSGLLLGLGESTASRLLSLDALAESHRRYGHLQEILLQPFQPNARSPLRHIPNPTGPDDFITLITAWHDRCPDVPIQIPPTLVPFWTQLLPLSDDLGGISPARDEVNPNHPWAHENHYRTLTASVGRTLLPRLPVYPRYINPTWIDPLLLPSVHQILASLPQPHPGPNSPQKSSCCLPTTS
ncbi:MAG: 7,8-didemethyl-8-hydroxy-5-deazariboflavin synthase subunit CofG [Verrucomicrobiia bacterium]